VLGVGWWNKNQSLRAVADSGAQQKSKGENIMKAERSRNWSSHLCAGVIAAALACTTIGCGSATKPTTTESAARAGYDKPADASQALQAAVRAKDDAAMTRILGSQSMSVLKTGDAVVDQAAMDSFTKKFDQMNRWVPMTNGSQMLYIGADNFAFPVPLTKDASGKWQFDSAAGLREITVRDIGRNELLAIDALQAFAGAEDVYAQNAHDGNPAHCYTQTIVSDSGKQDGLYWVASATEPSSPLGKLSDFGVSPIPPLGAGEPQVLDGYSIRILGAQGNQAPGGAKSFVVKGKMTGGYAIIATPVKYKVTGIKTFIVGKDGVIYQDDLGDQTADKVAAIKDYNPTPDWKEVE
jgi:hypothetical protein